MAANRLTSGTQSCSSRKPVHVRVPQYSPRFTGHYSHHSHYESPFRKVHVKPSTWQSIQTYFSCLFVRLEDFLSRHPSFLAFIRLVCLLSFLFLLLLSLSDVYHWLRHRRRRDDCSRGSGVDDNLPDDKNWVRRRICLEEGCSMTDQEAEKYVLGVGRHHSTLVSRNARQPTWLFCVPKEPDF